MRYRDLKKEIMSETISDFRVVEAGWCTKHRQRRWIGALNEAESYATFEVRDNGPECQAVTAQDRPGGATPCPRSGRRPGGAQRSRPVAAGRSQLAPKARGSDHEEPPRAVARGGSWEKQPMPEARSSG